jgi:hypothetical protein
MGELSTSCDSPYLQPLLLSQRQSRSDRHTNHPLVPFSYEYPRTWTPRMWSCHCISAASHPLKHPAGTCSHIPSAGAPRRSPRCRDTSRDGHCATSSKLKSAHKGNRRTKWCACAAIVHPTCAKFPPYRGQHLDGNLHRVLVRKTLNISSMPIFVTKTSRKFGCAKSSSAFHPSAQSRR